ncbi:ubiquinol-cytochrome C chaperone family protein [Microvirga sp. W0021]|uniref:Ubiquinol-cytochrome C chaperone family protein n=1 Tax=Hohaiivirga grylli TaxID=3133970 RepID=A0ABV0BI69_9HYPH
MFSFFKRKSDNRKVISSLYHGIARAALRPFIFAGFGVEDTLEGRFESLALHMAVVLRHMKNWAPPADDVASDLTDYYFTQLDDVLRELGTSDNKVPKKMKAMAGAFLSRAEAYDNAFKNSEMTQVLQERFGSAIDVAGFSQYVAAIDKYVSDSCLDIWLEKGIEFPEPQVSAGAVL